MNTENWKALNDIVRHKKENINEAEVDKTEIYSASKSWDEILNVYAEFNKNLDILYYIAHSKMDPFNTINTYDKVEALAKAAKDLYKNPDDANAKRIYKNQFDALYARGSIRKKAQDLRAAINKLNSLVPRVVDKLVYRMDDDYIREIV